MEEQALDMVRAQSNLLEFRDHKRNNNYELRDQLIMLQLLLHHNLPKQVLRLTTVPSFEVSSNVL